MKDKKIVELNHEVAEQTDSPVSKKRIPKQVNSDFQHVADRLIQIRDTVQRYVDGKPVAGRMKQDEIAKFAGCSSPSWSEYECARSLPTAKVLQTLIKAGYDANWILEGKGEMKISDTKLDKALLGDVISAVLSEIDNLGAKISPVGISGIIVMAYDNYRQSNDHGAMREQVKQLVEIGSGGIK